MGKKSFQNIPKPKRLTDETIESFEKSGPGHAPAWLDAAARQKTNEPKKRLSVDVPASTHRRFKTACSATSRKMVSELRRLVEARVLELEREIGNSNPVSRR